MNAVRHPALRLGSLAFAAAGGRLRQRPPKRPSATSRHPSAPVGRCRSAAPAVFGQCQQSWLLGEHATWWSRAPYHRFDVEAAARRCSERFGGPVHGARPGDRPLMRYDPPLGYEFLARNARKT